MKKVAVFTTFLLYSLSITFAGHPAFVPTHSPNPWKDDYRDLAKMENYRQWGAYNVHDPSCRKIGDYFYMYSTDAIFFDHRPEAGEKPKGFIQVRRSKDLVHWEFTGWAFPAIPEEAVEWVRSNAGGRGATNIWAPFIIPCKNKFRLYYCVSAFGRKDSYLGLAESDSPEGPWEQRGCVVKTNEESVMNAIDPTVIVDSKTGEWQMIYGSYFGGLFCVKLNPETGLTMQAGDKGHLVARRANYWKDNLEAPDIMYQPELKKYFLFVSYDPLMTTYNVRVGRSEYPDKDFRDFFGKEMKDTVNIFPILTAPYRFDNHPGWAGTGHCGVFGDEKGNYFMAHQGRLSPQNQLMVLHVRQLFFTPCGWPVVSPERYAGSPPIHFRNIDLAGEWELIRVVEPQSERQLEAGQVLRGEGELKDDEKHTSIYVRFSERGTLEGVSGKWSFSEKKQLLKLTIDGEKVNDLIVFAGHDWENETETVLFTGLDSRGRSVWGKRIK